MPWVKSAATPCAGVILLRLPVDGVEYRVDFDDWMYLIDSETMVNRLVMSKFGVELGQVTLFFRRRPA